MAAEDRYGPCASAMWSEVQLADQYDALEEKRREALGGFVEEETNEEETTQEETKKTTVEISEIICFSGPFATCSKVICCCTSSPFSLQLTMNEPEVTDDQQQGSQQQEEAAYYNPRCVRAAVLPGWHPSLPEPLFPTIKSSAVPAVAVVAPQIAGVTPQQ